MDNPDSTIFDRAKQLWDRVAIAAGLAYALGYASRALHAYDFNFGALPGARFEYLVAGFVLFLPIAALAATIWVLYRVGTLIKSWSERNPDRSKFLQVKVIGPVLVLCPIAFLVSNAIPQSVALHRGTTALFTMLVLAVIIGTILASGTPSISNENRPPPNLGAAATPTRLVERVLRRIGLLLSYFVAVYFALLLVSTFLLATFAGAYFLRYVPQEFGGVRAKCAILDLAADEMSAELTALLVDPAAKMNTNAKVVRSQRVAVFSTAGPWLVRASDPSTSSPMRRSFRLSEQAVRSVEWVGRSTPASASGRGCPDEP